MQSTPARVFAESVGTIPWQHPPSAYSVCRRFLSVGSFKDSRPAGVCCTRGDHPVTRAGRQEDIARVLPAFRCSRDQRDAYFGDGVVCIVSRDILKGPGQSRRWTCPAWSQRGGGQKWMDGKYALRPHVHPILHFSRSPDAVAIPPLPATSGRRGGLSASYLWQCPPSTLAISSLCQLPLPRIRATRNC